ncbi:SET and MYND domain-containing protein 4-like [Neocloeon triangulifer]|uniref:SET and MYND domain-containing protein 4-like n=1 Tax=Neocloeon triangulifer TaxID=2078957 RepID=UPI00286F80AD|nr:SET and MYND domain-containing protein 4-like [Neocloeon triangulifer]
MNLKEEDFKLFERKVAAGGKRENVSCEKFIEICQEIAGAEIRKEYDLLLTESTKKDKISQAEAFRKLGNDFLNLQKHHEAVEFYTRSATWAPKGSSARGQAYANRSAVLEILGQYEECIQDVDRAVKNDYPQMLLFKLYVRQSKCYKELKNQKAAKLSLDKATECILGLKLPEEKKEHLVESVGKEFESGLVPRAKRAAENYPAPPNVSYGKNKEAPSLSGAVCISSDEKFGRHLIAARDIQAGDFVLVEQPYAAVLAPECISTHCSHCMRRSNSLVPCDNCDWALFCSEECREIAKEQYHNEECPVASRCFKVIDEMNLQRSCHFIRIVTTFGLKKVKERLSKPEAPDGRSKGFNPDGIYKSDSFEAIFNLVTNLAQLPLLMIYAACTISIKIIKCFELADPKFENQLAAFCLKNLVALKNNAHEITHTHLGGASRVRYQVVGGGVFACSSLLNHSCNPNVFRTNYGTANVIQAIRHIRKGEQIFDSYKEHFAFDPKQDRQSYLLDHYHFRCMCEACENDWGLVQTLPIHPQFNLSKDKKIKSQYDQMITATFACADNAMPVSDSNVHVFLRVINTLSNSGSKALLTQTMQGAQEDLKNYFKAKGNCIF